jgi:Flp pilus assembly protein TadG
MFLASQVLDSAVEDATRIVRTGQAQTSGYSIDQFRAHMCDYTFGLFDCAQIKIKVQVLDKFGDASTAPPVQNCTSSTCNWTLTESFSPGEKREVIQVFAYYRWPLVVTLPYFNLKNQPDNYRLLSATRVFRNEPF